MILKALCIDYEPDLAKSNESVWKAAQYILLRVEDIRKKMNDDNEKLKKRKDA